MSQTSSEPTAPASPNSRTHGLFPIRLRYWNFGWLEFAFIALVLLALALRLWELDGRGMHYDEAIHLHYSWRLANLETFIHSPWMHGPFQIELAALFMRILGDTDFTSRLPYAIFGSALVGLPYFLRDYMGRFGALFTSVMLTLSPAMLYFSRFGRNDILMAFWAVALFVLLWRYADRSKNRYLYLASAVLALMFATKETAYFVTLTMGGIAFLLALPTWGPLLFGRSGVRQLSGAAGFFILLLTLTLPQWSALSGLFQGMLGLTLINPSTVSIGLVGAPAWAEPFVGLPLISLPWPVHVLLAGIFLTGYVGVTRFKGIRWAHSLIWTGLAALVLLASFIILFRPISSNLGDARTWLLIDLPVGGAIILSVGAVLVHRRCAPKQWVVTILIPALTLFFYGVFFTSLVQVGGLLESLLPEGTNPDVSSNGIPLNYLFAGGLVLMALALSAAIGILWNPRVWLASAAIFYSVWLTLYTTVFTNWAGMFSGVWQGMGYWIAQQEVARGNQPWYYYLVGLSVYELLPLVFGAAAAVYYFKKGDGFGLVLALWSALTLVAYTIASEKMPWLLVGVVLPLTFLAGRYLGELAERVEWGALWRRWWGLLLPLTPPLLLGSVFLLRKWLDPQASLQPLHFGLAVAVFLFLILSAYLVRRARPEQGMALAGLSVAGLLLVFGTWAALRATYTFDDSNKEILVYAQGSADVKNAFSELDRLAVGPEIQRATIKGDYELWYPLQWYVRHRQEEGRFIFSCFKGENEDGWNASCSSIEEDPKVGGLLLNSSHGFRDASALAEYQRSEPLRNLLWFPETYRRPSENRQSESFLEELSLDLQFFGESATDKEKWKEAIDYWLFRELESDWYNSEFFSYAPDSSQ